MLVIGRGFWPEYDPRVAAQSAFSDSQRTRATGSRDFLSNPEIFATFQETATANDAVNYLDQSTGTTESPTDKKSEMEVSLFVPVVIVTLRYLF